MNFLIKQAAGIGNLNIKRKMPAQCSWINKTEQGRKKYNIFYQTSSFLFKIFQKNFSKVSFTQTTAFLNKLHQKNTSVVYKEGNSLKPFLKILIVAPKFNSELRPQYNFPVGLACINSVLRKNGYDVKVLNLNHVWEDQNSVLERCILDNQIDVVMTGGLTAHYHLVKKIFQAVKEINKRIITIGGGGGFTAEPKLFTEMTGADYACVGEGEKTVCELMDAIVNKKDVSMVRGIVYKNDNGYIQTPVRAEILDFSDIPDPDYEGFEMERYLAEQAPYDYYYTYIHDEPRMFPIFMGRSCPYQCNFCFHPLGNTYRQRSIENFFAELDTILAKYKVHALMIFDELFSLDEKRIFEFCRRIKPYHLKWTVQMRVTIVNQPLLDAMRDAGCFNISYGLESINDKVLKNMNKKIKKEEIERALELTYQCRIGIQGNFIFGDEEEDMDTFSETLNWWREHRKYQINLAFIETYPGTQLYKNALQRGIIDDPRKFMECGCPIVNLTRLPDCVFKKMQDIVSVAELHDSEVMGKVISIEKNPSQPGFVKAVLECFHCHEVSVYQRIASTRIYSNNFKIFCRHCNQKSVYDTRKYLEIRDSEFKYKLYFTLLRQWKMYTDADCVEKYFNYYNINTIAVLYEDELGELLLRELNHKKIKVSYVIDEQAGARYKPISTLVPIIGIGDLKCAEMVDLLISTQVMHFKETRDEIRRAGYNGKIVSVEDIIFGITMQ